jgi:hypothetical protein
MELSSNKVEPQPVPKNFQASPKTSATKAILDPGLVELMGNVKEKKIDKSGKMRISDYDIFGEPIKFNWNKSDSYKTKTGVVFTALYLVVLGYISWMYFGEFIQCAQPNVYESIKDDLLRADDPDNNLANLFPVISFLDYSQQRPWPKGLPAVPFADITCHFGVKFGLNTANGWLSVQATPIPLNGDCNAKFKEMHKIKTGKDDETISKTHYLFCPDTTKLPLVGDGTECQGNGPCSYYSFEITNHFGPTDHCNPLNLDSTIVSISYINPKLTVDDFHNPWSYQIETEWTSLSQTQSQILIINHFYTTLETDARSFGLKSQPRTEKKLVRSPVVRIDTSPYLELAGYPYIQVL